MEVFRGLKEVRGAIVKSVRGYQFLYKLWNIVPKQFSLGYMWTGCTILLTFS